MPRTRITPYSMHRCFSVDIVDSTRGVPYDVTGVKSSKIQINHDMIVKECSSLLLKEGTARGFVDAYNALLDAIVDEDDVFIRDVCEPELADALISGLAVIKDKSMRLIKVIPESEEKFDLSYNRFVTFVNQPFERKEQIKKEFMESGPSFMQLRVKLPNLSSKFRVDSKGNFQIPILFSVVVEFNTNVYLKIVPRTGEDQSTTEVIIPQLPQIHRIEFVVPDKINLSLSEFAGNFEKIKSAKTFSEALNLFISDNYEWFINDVDDFMKIKAEIAEESGKK